MSLIAGVTASGATVTFEADGRPVERDVSPMRIGTGGLTAKSATASSGAATLNKQSGVITSEALTTAAGADYTLTLTNNDVFASDIAFASVQFGTSTTGDPGVLAVTPSLGQLKVVVRNHHASAALNGTIKISYLLFRI